MCVFSSSLFAPMDNPGSQDSAMPSNYSPQLGHSTQSSMSLASSSTLLDDQDEDVRIAVKALGDMRNGNIGGTVDAVATPALSLSISSIPATSIPSPTLSSISNPSPSNDNVQSDSDFVSRMAHIPLVTGALRMYEQGKASSRVVKV
ncbi:hypothetical protein J3R30DRAFT_3500178 [Lentinula aciculospora]|uniref:Uncharacterized protein n=1 Tax=Lentinula aciculospora TaxID=153920 RepID=A0A9W9A8U0_9AGAR|nr:hypothetical protein J3R30DRAFT_3500178 [Lentinula aciculospora]